jgi:hypothetical protein
MPLSNGKKMTEQEAKKIYSHQLAMSKVFGFDLKKACLEKGVPIKMLEKFIREDEAFDKGLSHFDWDGTLKKKKER